MWTHHERITDDDFNLIHVTPAQRELLALGITADEAAVITTLRTLVKADAALAEKLLEEGDAGREAAEVRAEAWDDYQDAMDAAASAEDNARAATRAAQDGWRNARAAYDEAMAHAQLGSDGHPHPAVSDWACR